MSLQRRKSNLKKGQIDIFTNSKKYLIRAYYDFKSTKYELDELAKENHQGIIIDVGEYEYYDLDDLIKEDNGFIVILDHLEDTHNFGAIIRTCVAAGVDGIVIPKDRSVGVNSTVLKTSVGSALNIKIAMVTNLSQAIKYLKDKMESVFKISAKLYKNTIMTCLRSLSFLQDIIFNKNSSCFSSSF